MPELQPLALLLERSERLRDAAIAEHRRMRTASEAAQAQTENLLAYRRDYEQRWRAQFCREGKIELVRHYQSFMERLTQAIDQQTRITEQAMQQVEGALAAVREQELRCASVRKLIERRLDEQRVHADRRDQNQTDEFAARAAWARFRATSRQRLI
jgi:flagellar FliJ protein